MATVKDRLLALRDLSQSEKVEAASKILLDAGIKEPVPDALRKSIEVYTGLVTEESLRPLLEEVFTILSRTSGKYLSSKDTDVTVALKVLANSPLFEGTKERNKFDRLERELKDWVERASSLLHPS